MFCTQGYQLCHLSCWPPDSLLPYFFPKLLQCPSTSAENLCRSYMFKENTKHIPDCSFTLWLPFPSSLVLFNSVKVFKPSLGRLVTSLPYFLYLSSVSFSPHILTSWFITPSLLFSYPSTAFMKAFSFTSSTPRFVSFPCSYVTPSFSKSPPLHWCQDTDSPFLLFLSPLPFGHQYLNCYSVKQQAFDFPLWDILHSSLLHSLVRLM